MHLIKTLPCALLLALLCQTPAAQAETYRIRLFLELQTTKVLPVTAYTKCSANQLAKLPPLAFGLSNVENDVVCLGKAGCTLTLHAPEAQTDPVQYYGQKNKVCEIQSADMTQAKEETAYIAAVDVPTVMMPKNGKLPTVTEKGRVVSVQKERVFTTFNVSYIDKPTVDTMQLDKDNKVDIFY